MVLIGVHEYSLVVLSIYHEILRNQDFERLDQYLHRK